MSRFALLLVAFGIGLQGALAQPEAAPLAPRDFDPQTDWYGVYIKGKKIGYCRMARDKVEDGVRESFILVMKLVSMDQKAEVTMRQSLVFETKPPYRMLRGEFVQEDGMVAVKVTLKRGGKGFVVTHQAAGETVTKEHGPIDYTFRDATAIERWVRQGPKTGAEIKSKDFQLQELKVEELTSVVKSVKKSVVAGVPVQFFEVETTSPMLSLLSRIDDQGRSLSSKLGGLFDTRLESEADAKNTEFSQDLFVLGTVKIDQPLGPARNVRELVIEFTGLRGAPFPDGPRQSVAPAGKEPGVLRLGKRHGRPAKATDQEIDENLKETLAYPISNPKIKELAQEAIGDAATAAEKVRRIVDFVHDYVKPSLSASLPNIPDLLARKSGDCKSYALLTATLCRAAGIPARELSGLVYMGDDARSFGGHAWNEVVIDGHWVPVDAAFHEADLDATHVSFGPQDRAAKGLLETMGKLTFRLIEIRTSR